jgi:hypothetical protein
MTDSRSEFSTATETSPNPVKSGVLNIEGVSIIGSSIEIVYPQHQLTNRYKGDSQVNLQKTFVN